MGIKIISVLCEGPHDVAFLSKIIKGMGFKVSDSCRLSDFPPPLDQLFLQEVRKTNFEELSFIGIRSVLLPQNTLSDGENWILLYSLGGDSRRDKRIKILIDFNDQNSEEGEFEILPENTELGIVYFFDADSEGIEGRVDKINKEIQKVVPSKPFTSNGDVVQHGKITLGCYVFCGPDQNTGKLEDIILPVMKEDNESIFDDAAAFLNKNYDLKRGRTSDYNLLKATIGVVGQLQKSGMTNQVIIGQTDYINERKLNSNDKCVEISEFFNKVILK